MLGFQLIRNLTLTLPLKARPGPDASGDHGQELTAAVQPHIVEVEGGCTVVREMVGDLSQHTCNSVTFAR